MSEDLNRPLLTREAEGVPAWRWWDLWLPVVMAVVGILVATWGAVAGQQEGRKVWQLEFDKRVFYWENELAQAKLRQAPEEEVAKLEVEAERARKWPPSPFVAPGRHFTQWDGNRYEEIVTDGYMYHLPGDTQEVKEARAVNRPGMVEPRTKNVVWFPLYPMLGWGVMKVLGVSATVGLTIVSELCVVLGAVVMYLLVRRHFGGRKLGGADVAAVGAVAAYLYGPCSVFLYANFTESLFALLLVMFLYCLQGRWWWRAALVAGVASACRSQGALFGPTLALVFLLRGEGYQSLKNWGMATMMGVISGVGLGCYMLYLQVVFGDPLAFVHAQSYWHVGLGAGSFLQAGNPMNALVHLEKAWLANPMDWPRLWEAMCVIWPPVVLAVFGRRYLSLEMVVVGVLLWGLPYVSNSLAGADAGGEAWMSMGRYMVVLVPAYVVAGALLERYRWVGVPLLAGWAAVFGIFAYKFGSGEWVG